MSAAVKATARATAGPSPFHAGERAIQSRLGIRDRMEAWGRQIIRPFLPDEHRAFYSQLPFVVAAARDAGGRVWATLLTGEPGFVSSPDDRSLRFSSRLAPGDALEDALVAGADVGLLGIELDTRRRNRVNGTIAETGKNGIVFDVGQTFGNCPQYITEREWYAAAANEIAPHSLRSRRLDGGARRRIIAADTFFIASGIETGPGDESRGMDASHRGGSPGFVRVLGDRRLVFPDYAGNNHFNTVGNLTVDPRVGLLFVDFEEGGLLQITGRATVDWDSAAIGEFPGAQRLVFVDIDEVVRLDAVLPLRWRKAAASALDLVLVDRVRESADVVSFEFEAADGRELPGFEAGQHLPLELEIDGVDGPVARTYSLSNAPGTGAYRISVKRQADGLVSRFLHDRVGIGSVLRASRPAGDFVPVPGERPIVLISAGVGVTPMMSMLHQLTNDADPRQVFFLHVARNGGRHAFAGEVRAVAERNPNVAVTIYYSQPADDDRPGPDYDFEGRIDVAGLEGRIPFGEAEIYLCGPPAFMAATIEGLRLPGVPADRIHTESF